MDLTLYQQEMLDGRFGKGKAMAMRIQVAIGDGFRAQRMVPITRAHVALSAQEADTWFARKLRDAGAVCAIPPTVNPGYCLKLFEQLGYINAKSSALMRETHEVYRDLGANLTYSCTPYLFGNIPRYRETVAFSETSVTVYANSVLGAKTNRESSASALCAAITGYVPEYGMLLDENRLGTILVQVDTPLEDEFDFALLGLNAKHIGRGVPVFTGIASERVSTEDLMALGTQLNVAGVADFFHMVGVTPDASDLSRAFGGHEPEHTVTITRTELDEQRKLLIPASTDRIDFVMLGCPHYTYRQICRAAALMERTPPKVPVWILTSAANTALAEANGLAQQLARCGTQLVSDTCVDEHSCWGHLAGQRGVTDSPKCAYYMRSFGVELAVCDVKTCLEWAGRGGIEA